MKMQTVVLWTVISCLLDYYQHFKKCVTTIFRINPKHNKQKLDVKEEQSFYIYSTELLIWKAWDPRLVRF
jgi:hypothetical protein